MKKITKVVEKVEKINQKLKLLPEKNVKFKKAKKKNNLKKTLKM
jgi:hypothetical protein